MAQYSGVLTPLTASLHVHDTPSGARLSVRRRTTTKLHTGGVKSTRMTLESTDRDRLAPLKHVHVAEYAVLSTRGVVRPSTNTSSVHVEPKDRVTDAAPLWTPNVTPPEHHSTQHET